MQHWDILKVLLIGISKTLTLQLLGKKKKPTGFTNTADLYKAWKRLTWR